MAELDMTNIISPDDNILDVLRNIFNRSGLRAYGDMEVTLSEHMLLSAAAAERAGEPPHIVAAALLHDMGHFGTDFRENFNTAPRGSMTNAKIDRRHEEAGAKMLEPFFGPEVLEPIRLHVQAKRYLSTVESGYIDTLSPQSVHTLGLQGGQMSSKEVTAFKANPYFEAAVAVRRYDDAGSVPGPEGTLDFEHYRPLIKNLLKE